jgi:hypothetical protein
VASHGLPPLPTLSHFQSPERRQLIPCIDVERVCIQAVRRNRDHRLGAISRG